MLRIRVWRVPLPKKTLLARPLTLLIPIIAFVVMGERRDAAMKAMREWLNRNQRMVNVVVLGFFGLVLLIKGLSVMFG
jgi:Sap-like sulfolipid-1-addressing protein